MKSEHGRNEIVDEIRGVAMLLVIAGHTIANSNLIQYEDNFLFKVIWALQMPLFMLISGWVGHYSKPIASAGELGRYVGKKSLAYLLPWCVWTIGIRGFLLGGWTIRNFSGNILRLLWHMDSGYWFLTSLWTIQILWGISAYLCRRVFRAHALCKAILAACVSLGLAVILLVAGHFLGYSFFGIKLTCYYLPFFLIGCVFPYLKEARRSIFDCPVLERAAAALSAAVFLYLVISRNFYTAEDTVRVIIERVVCSLCGCAALCCGATWLRGKMSGGFPKLMAWIGTHTLELYLCHNLFLGMLDGQGLVINSLKGAGIASLNFFLTVLLSAALVIALSYNRYARLILFGKTFPVQSTRDKNR